MKQLPYGSSAATLRFEFPPEWDASDVSAVTITVNDRDGDELLSAQSATIYTATTLDADADRFAGTITLASGAGALYPGDLIHIAGAGGEERHRVKGYDSTTRVVTLEGILENEYDSGDSVYAAWCSYSYDISTTTTYTAGIVLVLVWTPTGDAQPATEMVQVATSALDIEGLEKRFAYLYPRAYDAFVKPVNRFAAMVEEAELQLANELMADNFHIQRVVDSSILAPVIMAKMAWFWVMQSDEQMVDEREAIGAEYDKQIGFLRKNPIWIDSNQDGVEDEEEVTSHEPIFGRGW